MRSPRSVCWRPAAPPTATAPTRRRRRRPTRPRPRSSRRTRPRPTRPRRTRRRTDVSSTVPPRPNRSGIPTASIRCRRSPTTWRCRSCSCTASPDRPSSTSRRRCASSPTAIPADRIVAFEHDGAGMDIAGYAAGLAAVVDARLAEFGVEQVYLVGHSRGTLVSQHVLDRPGAGREGREVHRHRRRAVPGRQRGAVPRPEPGGCCPGSRTWRPRPRRSRSRCSTSSSSARRPRSSTSCPQRDADRDLRARRQLPGQHRPRRRDPRDLAVDADTGARSTDDAGGDVRATCRRLVRSGRARVGPALRVRPHGAGLADAAPPLSAAVHPQQRLRPPALVPSRRPDPRQHQHRRRPFGDHRDADARVVRRRRPRPRRRSDATRWRSARTAAEAVDAVADVRRQRRRSASTSTTTRRRRRRVRSPPCRTSPSSRSRAASTCTCRRPPTDRARSPSTNVPRGDAARPQTLQRAELAVEHACHQRRLHRLPR